METTQEGNFSFSLEETVQIQGKRRELQAMLRFINRTYIALLCRGRTQEAAELLAMYRGLGELDLHRFFGRQELPPEVEPIEGAPDDRL